MRKGSGLRAQSLEGQLPVHGFVLAGGKSSRMGTDKALLEVGGRAMVEIAIEKLRGFCVDVSIAGNREDLSRFAPVVREQRMDVGPAAGIEAGLVACTQPWALFVPVDVPLVPGELLRRWVEGIFEAGPGSVSCASLCTGEQDQPSFSLLRREVLPVISKEIDRGTRRLVALWGAVQEEFGVVRCGAREFASGASVEDVERWFRNVNTPEDVEVVREMFCGGAA